MAATLSKGNFGKAYLDDTKIKQIYLNDVDVWDEGVQVNITIASEIEEITEEEEVPSGCDTVIQTTTYEDNNCNIKINATHYYEDFTLVSIDYSGDSRDGIKGTLTLNKSLPSQYTYDAGWICYGESSANSRSSVRNFTLTFLFSAKIDGVVYTKSLTKTYSAGNHTYTISEKVVMDS